ncbi:MAG: hypothetical protein WKF66_14200 [Pedobacter sp.]
MKLEQFFGIEHGGMSHAKVEEVHFELLYNEWRDKRININLASE